MYDDLYVLKEYMKTAKGKIEARIETKEIIINVRMTERDVKKMGLFLFEWANIPVTINTSNCLEVVVI